MSEAQDIERHYGTAGLLESIRKALPAAGKDPDRLRPEDLAPVDEFHVRGREATVELAGLARLEPGSRVLDVGCGLGGSARYLAQEHRCRAVGIDVTGEYVKTARALAEMVGLSSNVHFIQAAAPDVPLAGGLFDAVWAEHVQMNIADKRGLYAEAARLLKPGGRLVFHEVLRGEGGEPYYPLPWAGGPSISFLPKPAALRDFLRAAGFSVVSWTEKSRESLEWFAAAVERLKKEGRPPLGLHLVMGPNAGIKSQNQVRSLRENRILLVQGLAEKPCR